MGGFAPFLIPEQDSRNSRKQAEFAIKGAKVWHRGTFVETSVSILAGKIHEISKTAHERASRTLDADGKYLIPGLIDLHVHTRDPGFTYKEDFASATRAALAGGVTTIVDMPNLKPPPNTASNYLEKMKDSKQKSLCDYNHWALPTKLEEISKIASLGAIGYKFFMIAPRGKEPPVYPYLPETSIVDYGQIMRTFEEISKTRLPCVVHPLEPEIWREAEKEISEIQGRHDIDAYLDCYSYKNSLTLTSSTAVLVMIANSCNSKLRIAHTCWRPQLELARTLKRGGYRFTTELNPFALFLSREDNKRLGPFSHGIYHEGEEQESIYEFMMDGTVDIIATDHAPHTKEELERGKTNFFDSPKGTPVVQDYLKLFLDAVNNGKLGLETVVRLACENPAKHAQFFPRKGTIEAGSDADLVLLDMGKRYSISSKKAYTKSGWTPWDGREVKGSPERVFLRGEVVMEDYDNVTGKEGYGEFVKPIIAE